jgi:hypothetical protein
MVSADTLETGGASVFSNTDMKKGTVYTDASKTGAKGLPFLKVLENRKTKKSLLFC